MAEARILIVDDDPQIRAAIEFTLEAAGYQTETAASGEDALVKFGMGDGWDLVLLDQRMAGLQGLEVLRRLRGMNVGVPVILLTAYSTVELAASVLGSGASGFLRKPMSPEELRRIVRDVLKSHPPLGAAGGQPG
jgi:DNA-binding response OmpR family regulator